VCVCVLCVCQQPLRHLHSAPRHGDSTCNLLAHAHTHERSACVPHLKMWLPVYAPSVASLKMCADVRGATCRARRGRRQQPAAAAAVGACQRAQQRVKRQFGCSRLPVAAAVAAAAAGSVPTRPHVWHEGELDVAIVRLEHDALVRQALGVSACAACQQRAHACRQRQQRKRTIHHWWCWLWVVVGWLGAQWHAVGVLKTEDGGFRRAAVGEEWWCCDDVQLRDAVDALACSCGPLLPVLCAPTTCFDCTALQRHTCEL
jgi:hypothetical protein